MTDKLLCGAAAIGKPYGWSKFQVYRLVEDKPDFPAFRLNGPRARLYARPQDIDSWLENRAQRGRTTNPVIIN